MRIGTVNLSHPVTLAPMEEHTSLPFRKLCKQYGASLVCSERIDAIDVARGDKRALKLLSTIPGERPAAGQISGGDPQVMAEAAKGIEQQGFSIVDLNFECPIKRLMNRGEGGALMAEPEKIAAIAAAVVRAVSIPVTLKIRSGPDAQRETAVDIARLAEQAGIAAIDVHARSVQQAYVGPADWSVVTRVKNAVSLPVMGSGSIRDASDVVKFLRETQADAVAIGRGCLGNPWIFSQARSLIQGGVQLAQPTPTERGRAVWQLVEDEFSFYGHHRALKRLPRTACYFAKWLPNFTEFRDQVHVVRSLAEFRQLVRSWFR